jgi:predicted HTH transcriptional regulator
VPPEPINKELALFIAENRKGGSEFDLNELLVLHAVRFASSITSRRATDILQTESSEARTVLHNLTDKGVLKTLGRGNGRYFRFVAPLARRFGHHSKVSRRAEQRQAIRNYIAEWGSISRREVVTMLDLNTDQASRLLRAMRDEGQLEMVGTHRATRYILPDQAPDSKETPSFSFKKQ